MSVLRSILGSVREVLRSFRGALMVQLMSRGLWEGRQFRQCCPLGVYYFDIPVTGTTSGIYSFEWEEL